MKYIFLYTIFSLPWFLGAQPVVHQGVFYRDDEGVVSGFMADKIAEIQGQLDYMKNNEVYVNVLLMTKECPDLKFETIDGVIYFEGPVYSYNGVETSLWGVNNSQSFTLQILPRQAKLYHVSSSGNSFWNVTDADFDYPLLLHNDKYYCIIKKALNTLCAAKGLDVFNPTIDCVEGTPQEVENAILILPQTYLQRSVTDIDDFKGSQIVAKTNFCTNLFYYGPYLHTRSTEDDLRGYLANTVDGGFVLTTIIPSEIAGSAVFKDVLLDIDKGNGYSDNCYPTFRELSEQDRIEVLHKMHGGSSSGATSSLSNVKAGSKYLLERLLGSAQSPVPGNTNCGYGAYTGGDGSNPGNYNFVPGPYFQFYGLALPVPGSNNHVTWFNDFEGMSEDVISSCTQAAESAETHGLNLQFSIASGCTPNVSQFENSRSKFEQTNPPGAAAGIWMYYDECDHRLYYDVKVSAGFTVNLNPGYGITDPDSIALIRAAVEDIVKGILDKASKMSSYENANLDESEYPENMHNNALSGFFGEGTSCDDEAPWKFGIRDGYDFTVSRLGGECLVVLLQIITDQQTPQRLWHPHPTDSCMLDLPGAGAGIIDACLNQINGKVWNLIGLMSAAVAFYEADAGTRKEVLKSISNPLNLILGQYPQNIQCIDEAECQEERIYCFSSLSINSIFDLLGGAVLGAVGNIANVGKVIDDRLGMFVPDFSERYNEWKRTLTVAGQRKLHQFMGDITESAKFKLAKRVTLNKIWQKFEAGQLSGVTKQELQLFVERLPAHDQHDFYHKFDEIFTDELGEITDPDKVKAFIEDVNTIDPEDFVNVFNEFPEKYFNAWDVTNTAGLVHLRKNVGFLHTADEYISGQKEQKFLEYNCTMMDEIVIRHYTTPYHDGLNRALVGADPMTDEFLEFKTFMNQALIKLPDHNGLVYRGLGKFESDLTDKWKIGDNTDIDNWDKKFISTSTEYNTAEDFRVTYGGHVIIKIDPCTKCKDVSAIAVWDEQEILYPTGQSFEVLNITRVQENPDIFEIELKEL